MPRPIKWLRQLFKRGPRQTVAEGEGTVDAHDPPCSSGQKQAVTEGEGTVDAHNLSCSSGPRQAVAEGEGTVDAHDLQCSSGPRQAVGEGEGTAVDARDLPCSSGSVPIQRHGLDNTSQISGTSGKLPLTDKPPYIPEYEIFEEGDPGAEDKFKNCYCHCKDGFIAVKDFTLDHVPEEYRGERTWEQFQVMKARTVKVVVNYTSKHRPDTHPGSTDLYPRCRFRGSDKMKYTGTGYIIALKIEPKMPFWKCPCHTCKCQNWVRGNREYFTAFVVTAAHVVFDEWEAEKTVCEVFDDDPDKKDGVKLLYGVTGADSESLGGIGKVGLFSFVQRNHDIGNRKGRPTHDMFIMKCISHDWGMYEELKSVLGYPDRLFDEIPVIVSHPHGTSKMVSVGTRLTLQIPLSQTRTHDTPYTIRVDTDVNTEIDLEARYPGFFKKQPFVDAWYKTTQPLHLYIPCDESNTATLRLREGSRRRYFLPEGSRLTSVDGVTDIPCDGLGFHVYNLLSTIPYKDWSYHWVYDIHTCKGSSGALVVAGGGHALNPFKCHNGKVNGGGGLNKTGMYEW